MDRFTERVARGRYDEQRSRSQLCDALVAPSAVRQLFDAAAEPKTYELIEATHTDAAERSRFVVVRWLRAMGFEYAHA
jgi:hypothetical protein